MKRDFVQSHAAFCENTTTELEQQLEMRTAELEAANKQLEILRFSLSHELRAPLRAMDGFSQMLLRDYGAASPPQLRDYLTTIQQEARRAAAMIDDLLARVAGSGKRKA